MAGQIGKEISQSKPMSLAVEASLNVQRTAGVLRDLVEQATQSAGGVQHVEYNVLRILRGAGPEGTTLDEIRDRLIADDPHLLATMGKLANRGLIGRKGQHRVITDEALKLLQTVDDRVEKKLEERTGRLSVADLRKLVDFLETLRA